MSILYRVLNVYVYDLIGYPDGWNNFAYCNNASTIAFDYMGAWVTGNDYSINDPNTPYGTVLDTRTPERDMSLAQNAYEYFLLKKAYLSASLVNYVMVSTEVQNSNGYDIGSRYSEEIISDNGFNSVRNFVKNIMDSASIGQTVTFNHKISTTLNSNYDLAKSIHGVTFTITGTIYKGSEPWSGMLNISYSDPYDFKSNDPDWKVRVFGRLYENGWITKFNVKGNFYAEFNE